MPKFKLTEATRAYIYRVAAAAFAVALVYGLISKDDIAVWVQFLSIVLGVGTTGLAAKHTSTARTTAKPKVKGPDRGAFSIQEVCYLLGAVVLLGIIILWIAGRN